jgi:UDP-N-acetylmuramate dehydrogenase
VTHRFSDYTSLAVGGEMGTYVPLTSKKDAVKKTLEVWAAGHDWLVLGGGTNLFVGDDGFGGHVLHTQFTGRRETTPKAKHSVIVEANAGESWDGLVDYTVARGLSGLEAMSGIPGCVGASVIQNIGAYGHEVHEVLHSVEVLDYHSREIVVLGPDDLEFDFRTSAFKTGTRRGLILSVSFSLSRDDHSLPITYSQLADSLSVSLGDTAPLRAVREAVLALRASKAMVIDPNEPDSVSVGSFFMNPVVSESFAHTLPAECPRWYLDDPADEVFDLSEGIPDLSAHHTLEARVKLSAAWLIEQSGIQKGFRLPGSTARVSTKHSLAITNPNRDATSAEIAQLARYIRTSVGNRFGLYLAPEPTLVGIDLGD